MTTGAILSDCGRFRYRLWREWSSYQRAIFVMLNPSTADASADDPTIRKCVGFAQRMGYGGIEVVNLYAFRATKPAELKRAGYPRGPENDDHIRDVLRQGDRTAICAWGVNARGLSRPMDVLDIIRAAGVTPTALKRSADGIPLHPLMLPYTCEPVPL